MFTGVFEGNGYAIRDLFIQRDEHGQGLFGSVSANAEIRNLVLDSPNVTGNLYVGALIGQITGDIFNDAAGRGVKINNIIVDHPTVRGARAVGGIVGNMYYGEIRNVIIKSPTLSGRSHVGGLMGSASKATISSCHSRGGTVSGPSGNDKGSQPGRIAGLVGAFYGPAAKVVMEECSAREVAIQGSIGRYFGGLVGYLNTDVRSCFATGSVKGGKDAGGLVGGMPSGSIKSLKYTYARVDINLTEGTGGGLVGRLGLGSVLDSFAAGTVEGGTVNSVGGLIGRNDGASLERNYAVMDPAIGNVPKGASGVELTEENEMPELMKRSWDRSVWKFRGSAFPDLRCLPEFEIGGPYSGNRDTPIHLNEATTFDGATVRWTVDNEKCSFNNNKVLDPVLTCRGIRKTPAVVTACVKVTGSDTTIFRDCTTVSIAAATKSNPFPEDLKDITCAYSECVAQAAKKYGGRTNFGDAQNAYDTSKRKARYSKRLIAKNRDLNKSLKRLKEAMFWIEQLRETAPDFSNKIGENASLCGIILVEGLIEAYKGKGILDDTFVDSMLEANLEIARAKRKAKKWKNSVSRCQAAINITLKKLGETTVPLC